MAVFMAMEVRPGAHSFQRLVRSVWLVVADAAVAFLAGCKQVDAGHASRFKNRLEGLNRVVAVVDIVVVQYRNARRERIQLGVAGHAESGVVGGQPGHGLVAGDDVAPSIVASLTASSRIPTPEARGEPNSVAQSSTVVVDDEILANGGACCIADRQPGNQRDGKTVGDAVVHQLPSSSMSALFFLIRCQSHCPRFRCRSIHVVGHAHIDAGILNARGAIACHRGRFYQTEEDAVKATVHIVVQIL